MPIQPGSPFEHLKLEEGLAHLRAGARSRSRVFLWNEGQRHDVDTRILDLIQTRNPFMGDAGLSEIWIELDRTDGFTALEAHAYSLMDRTIFVRLKTPSAVLFCQCELPPASLGHLDSFRVKLNSPIYAAQRRAVFRLPLLSSGAEVRIKFEIEGREGTVHSRLKDLGESGAALVLDDLEHLAWLQPKTHLRNLKFKLERKEIELKLARVSYSHTIAGPKTGTQLQVGIQFLQVPNTIRSWLSGYIFEKSTRFYGRR